MNSALILSSSSFYFTRTYRLFIYFLFTEYEDRSCIVRGSFRVGAASHVRVGGRRRTPTATIAAVLPSGPTVQRARRPVAQICGNCGQPATASFPLGTTAGGRGAGGRRTAQRRRAAPAQRARSHPAAVQTATDATGTVKYNTRISIIHANYNRLLRNYTYL